MILTLSDCVTKRKKEYSDGFENQTKSGVIKLYKESLSRLSEKRFLAANFIKPEITSPENRSPFICLF